MKKIKTLKTKIIIMLLATSLIPVLNVGITTYVYSKQILNRKLETTSSQTIQEVTRGLDNYLEAMSNIVQILSSNGDIRRADNAESFQFAKTLITDAKESNVNITNVFVGTEKGMFYVEPAAQLPSGFNHKDRGWYQEAIANKGEFAISDPYIDTGSGEVVITISKAVMEGAQVVGVVGIDIDLATLAASLSDIKIGGAGYIFVTDRNGIMISHPNPDLLGTDEATSLSVWSEIEENENGFTSYVYEGNKRFASYNISPLTGWKIVASMDYSELSNDTREIRDILIISILVTVAGVFIVAILFSRPISKNIRMLLNSFDKLSKGDLRNTLTIKSKDEFGLLSEHFNTMVEELSTLVNNIHIISDTVLDTSVSLSNVSEETNASLIEVARAVGEVASGATEQAGNSADEAASVAELAGQLDVVEESSSTMNQLSKNATSITIKGLSSVKALISKSCITMESTEQVSALVFETNESMKQIDEISNTIDAITARTSLLSLNASIEAARAGESGRGFSVVADEIRKLAEQSKASTVEIKKIVEQINEKTELSVAAMKETTENVKEQEALVRETRKSFQEIAEAVRILSKRISEIQASTKEIALKKDSIVEQIENISAISEETASATEEVTASTEQISITMEEISKSAGELQTLSKELKDRLDIFKTS